MHHPIEINGPGLHKIAPSKPDGMVVVELVFECLGDTFEWRLKGLADGKEELVHVPPGYDLAIEIVGGPGVRLGGVVSVFPS